MLTDLAAVSKVAIVEVACLYSLDKLALVDPKQAVECALRRGQEVYVVQRLEIANEGHALTKVGS